MNFNVVNARSVFTLIFISTILFFCASQLFSLWIEHKIINIIKDSSEMVKVNNIKEENTAAVGAAASNNYDNIPMFQRLIELDATTQTEELSHEEQLIKAIPCYDRFLKPKVEQHGDFWVLSNYVRASEQFRCYESITYTTHGDYTFLDNLTPLVQRWDGPISIALHAPGTDFQPTLDSIAYLRNCEIPEIKKRVTFHLLFDMGHAPSKPSKQPFDLPLLELYEDSFNCNKDAPYTNISHKELYKTEANISYPINVARNVARENSQTYFILASDIELYPSLNIVDSFLNMILNKPYLFENENPMIFVLPVFQVLSNESAPTDKTSLKELIDRNTSFSFHAHICKRCHAIPKLDEWLGLEINHNLDIFTVAKRQGKLERWEAVYIGTNEDPFFDETLDWERHGNKMTQAYALCVLNYDYMVLDNAFLVHKPGIKEKMVHAEVIPKTAKFIREVLGMQFNKIYGKRKGCKA